VSKLVREKAVYFKTIAVHIDGCVNLTPFNAIVLLILFGLVSSR
jgi:hypothetical protein